MATQLKLDIGMFIRDLEGGKLTSNKAIFSEHLGGNLDKQLKKDKTIHSTPRGVVLNSRFWNSSIINNNTVASEKAATESLITNRHLSLTQWNGNLALKFQTSTTTKPVAPFFSQEISFPEFDSNLLFDSNSYLHPQNRIIYTFQTRKAS